MGFALLLQGLPSPDAGHAFSKFSRAVLQNNLSEEPREIRFSIQAEETQCILANLLSNEHSHLIRMADTPCCLSRMAIAGLGFAAWTICSNDRTFEFPPDCPAEQYSSIALMRINRNVLFTP